MGGGALRVTILGCGSSAGVPRIGGDWGACDPANPRNRRSRSSILVERRAAHASDWAPETTTVALVDTAPELRLQLLDAGVGRLDGVLYTHDHADQTHGVDDLRILALRQDRRVPVFMSPETYATLGLRFRYCFEQAPGSLYPPILAAHPVVEAGETIAIDGPGGPIEALALAQEHGPTRSLGFRFGPLAYSNDVSALPRASLDALHGLELWIVDALRWTPHPTHAHVAQALAWIEALRPKRALLTNLHVDLDYAALDAATPAHVAPAYDGLQTVVPL